MNNKNNQNMSKKDINNSNISSEDIKNAMNVLFRAGQAALSQGFDTSKEKINNSKLAHKVNQRFEDMKLDQRFNDLKQAVKDKAAEINKKQEPEDEDSSEFEDWVKAMFGDEDSADESVLDNLFKDSDEAPILGQIDRDVDFDDAIDSFSVAAQDLKNGSLEDLIEGFEPTEIKGFGFDHDGHYFLLENLAAAINGDLSMVDGHLEEIGTKSFLEQLLTRTALLKLTDDRFGNHRNLYLLMQRDNKGALHIFFITRQLWTAACQNVANHFNNGLKFDSYEPTKEATNRVHDYLERALRQGVLLHLGEDDED